MGAFVTYNNGCRVPVLAALRLFILAAVPLAVPGVAQASITVVGSLSHEYAVEPAGRYQGTVEIRNSGTTPQEVRVYQSDYISFADGRSLYGEPGSLPRSNARWITFSPAQITVPPDETMRVLYSIQVPDDSTLRGTYWSVLLVEPIAEGSPESATTQAGKVSVTIRHVVRYSVHVIAEVASATAARDVRFARLELEHKDGRPMLSVDVENSGERWMIGDLSAEVYDTNGKFTGRFAGGKKRLYPGGGARFAVDLTGVDHGTYQALLVLDSGGDDVFGADVTLVLQ
jgi:hypothetical protein